MHHPDTLRHLDGHNDAADWRWSFLRNDVPRVVAGCDYVRSRFPPEALVDRGYSDDLCGDCRIDGCTRLHDSVCRLPGDRRNASQSVQSVGLESRGTYLLRRFHGHHVHPKDTLDCHPLLPQHRHVRVHFILEDVLQSGSSDTSDVHRLDTI